MDLRACRKRAVIERIAAPLFSPHCRLRFMDEAMAPSHWMWSCATTVAQLCLGSLRRLVAQLQGQFVLNAMDLLQLPSLARKGAGTRW
jgi:hypothetical protein